MHSALLALGLPAHLADYQQLQTADGHVLGRICAQHRDRYQIWMETGVLDAELTGHLRYTATDALQLPYVGDWVVAQPADTQLAVVHRLLPRYSLLQRQAAGGTSQIQLIAANIDYALLVQAADRDFSPNRLERYLALCHQGGVQPVVVLNKIDQITPAELHQLLHTLHTRLPDVPCIALSLATGQGLDALHEQLLPSKTYCLLGSSGVGKSTLLNLLTQAHTMQTAHIGQGTQRGRHTTTHRQLVRLPNGSLLIDNPGLREVGIADAHHGIEQTFEAIAQLAHQCKYADCTHTSEAHCAVLQALEQGEIDPAAYQNYLAMLRESAYFEANRADRRKKEKQLGKLMKNFKKNERNKLP